MGVDTLKRLLNKKYYSGCDFEMVAALATIESRGVDVYVGGRADGSTGAFETMHTFFAENTTPKLPVLVRNMFHEIREEDFRVDVSSTQIRARVQRPSV